MAQTRSKPAMIPPPPHKKTNTPAKKPVKKTPAPTVKDVRAAAQALLSLAKRVK